MDRIFVAEADRCPAHASPAQNCAVGQLHLRLDAHVAGGDAAVALNRGVAARRTSAATWAQNRNRRRPQHLIWIQVSRRQCTVNSGNSVLNGRGSGARRASRSHRCPRSLSCGMRHCAVIAESLSEPEDRNQHDKEHRQYERTLRDFITPRVGIERAPDFPY